MIRGVERNQLRLSKSKKQMKELTDTASQQRLQYVDNLIAKALENQQQSLANETITSRSIQSNRQNEPQQSEPITSPRNQPRQFNKNKYTDADRTTAQVTPQEVLDKLSQSTIEPQPIIIPQTIQANVTDNHLNAYLSHPNLEVMKFVVDCIWKTVTHRNRGDDFILSSDNFIKFWSIVTQEKEDDIEIVLEESIIATHSCLSKQYKKKEIVRVIDVLIKNVSINTQDNVLWNSVEKLYRINKDLVRLSDVPAIDIDPNEF
ncbi:MAG: hypothetical protein EZS28_014190 [Streblomastix strix]|uniref:Uncharacterized protein n=1 Tax=Streblomastix strix TaxID=222440 RepID=A0A5J4W5T5_9EUKA|nr:MAG: hypothetical protein EZS28_014189 [Streblomastix strix]KAA6390285.1 MAG: hypothetical protein EZS28_014190 [Streblomastix strix]